MSDVAISLTFKDTIDQQIKSILLDNVQSNSVDESSTITRHPVPSGDMIADHSFRQPTTMRISGCFSSNGNKGIIFENNSFSLIDVQSLFSRIKDQGILCNIVKVNTNENDNPLFSIRHDMALQSIGWVENINSLDFSFTFTQVMTVDINEFDVDDSDMYLPDVTDPNVLSFTESPLFNKDHIVREINKAVVTLNVAQPEFMRFLSSHTKSVLIASTIGIGVTVATTAAITVALGAAITATAATGIGAIIGVKLAEAYLVWRIYKFAEESAGLKIRQFRKHRSKKKNEQEAKRYEDMVNDLVSQFDALNDQISVYKVSASGQQQCLLTIDDDYYCFTFLRNNVDDSHFKLSVLDLENNLIASMENVKEAAIQSLDGCSASTALMVVSNIQVFIINPIDSSERTDDLTENYILISKIDMGRFNEMIADVIKRYLVY